MKIFALNYFMKYPNFSLKLAMCEVFYCEDSNKLQENNKLYKWAMKLWFYMGAINLVYQNIGMLVHLLVPQLNRDYGEEDLVLIAKISETGGIMGLTLVGACKMWIMLSYKKSIIVLLEEFQQIFPKKLLQQKSFNCFRIEYYANKSNKLMKRTTWFFLFAFSFYNSLPIVEFLYEYFIDKDEIKYRYQSNTWYPWQTESNRKSLFFFILAYLCQVQSSLTGVAFIMAGEYMLCFFMTQMEMHFDFLVNSVESLDASRINANEQLRYLIEYHNRLLRLCKEINNVFNMSFLVNFITSTIAICLMGFSMVMISMIHAFKYSVGLLSFLVFTLFLCYTGNEFTTTSARLMPAAFYSNWWEGNLSYQKMMNFFVMRATKENVLRAYKFTPVSMQTYMTILKFSYQLFTFFRAMG